MKRFFSAIICLLILVQPVFAATLNNVFGIDPIGWRITAGNIPATTTVGASYTMTYTLQSNLRKTMPTPLMISIASTPNTEFSFNDQCNGVRLAPKASCSIIVSFQPHSSGNKSFQITMSYGVNTVPLPLRKTSSGPSSLQQRIAIPSYFYPDCGSNPACYWGQLDNAIPKVGLAIINPADGPGGSLNSDYASQTLTTQGLGGIVLGYVFTSYGTRPLSEIETDIDKYYTWYGVDGIFFDEGFSTDCSALSYYQTLNNYVKAKGGKGITVINFGDNTPECYVNATDILLIFEDAFVNYPAWQPSPWVFNYPASRFWHLVYATPENNLLTALQLSSARNAGWIYVTNDDVPNPWDTLPTGSYWTTLLNWIH